MAESDARCQMSDARCKMLDVGLDSRNIDWIQVRAADDLDHPRL